MARWAILLALLAMTCTFATARTQHNHQHGNTQHGNTQHGNTQHGNTQSAPTGDVEQFEGYVLDKHCAKAEGDALSDAAKGHTRACLLKGACSRSGFGLVVDGKWYAFDRRGSAQAARLIRTPYFAQHEKWDVSGTKKDGVIYVSKLEVTFDLR